MRTIQTAYCELIIIDPLEFLHFLALRSCHERLLLHLLPEQRCAATSAPAICRSKQLHCAHKYAEARVTTHSQICAEAAMMNASTRFL